MTKAPMRVPRMVPLPPESLVGLTVEEARRKRNDRMFAIASGNR